MSQYTCLIHTPGKESTLGVRFVYVHVECEHIWVKNYSVNKSVIFFRSGNNLFTHEQM